MCGGERHYTFVSMQIQTHSLNLLDKHGSGRGALPPTSSRVGGGARAPGAPPVSATYDMGTAGGSLCSPPAVPICCIFHP